MALPISFYSIYRIAETTGHAAIKVASNFTGASATALVTTVGKGVITCINKLSAEGDDYDLSNRTITIAGAGTIVLIGSAYLLARQLKKACTRSEATPASNGKEANLLDKSKDKEEIHALRQHIGELNVHLATLSARIDNNERLLAALNAPFRAKIEDYFKGLSPFQQAYYTVYKQTLLHIFQTPIGFLKGRFVTEEVAMIIRNRLLGIDYNLLASFAAKTSTENFSIGKPLPQEDNLVKHQAKKSAYEVIQSSELLNSLIDKYAKALDSHQNFQSDTKHNDQSGAKNTGKLNRRKATKANK